jgi:hypothetical protein
MLKKLGDKLMPNNNGKPKVTPKQIAGLIAGFEKQLLALEQELEAADTALSDAKLQEIERQRMEYAADDGVLPRMQAFVIEDFPEKEHLEYQRGRAVGKLADVQRRIKLLRRALGMELGISVMK